MKKKLKLVNQQELDTRFMKLNRKRAKAYYERHMAENEGNTEAYNELDKQISDLNEEIAALEVEAKI
jgi:uncharacterized FlaG/YvyC family protein